MSKNREVMITCAVTGAIRAPSMAPHLPITAPEIADAAIGAAEAGAALVHQHSTHVRSAFGCHIAFARFPLGGPD